MKLDHDLTCRELVEFLSEYIDGTLSAAEVAAFEDHLNQCRDCRTYIESYRMTMKLTREVSQRDSNFSAFVSKSFIFLYKQT